MSQFRTLLLNEWDIAVVEYPITKASGLTNVSDFISECFVAEDYALLSSASRWNDGPIQRTPIKWSIVDCRHKLGRTEAVPYQPLFLLVDQVLEGKAVTEYFTFGEGNVITIEVFISKDRLKLSGRLASYARISNVT